MSLRLALPLLLFFLLACCGCPPASEERQADQGNPAVPSEPLPAMGKLLDYHQLRLGMNSLDIARLYPAPNGKGEGYVRVIQDFGIVQHHIIKFDDADGEPHRRLVLALLRDELYMLVDRRDILSSEQATAWREELAGAYGEHSAMTIGDAQWRWGPENGVELIFTQDNSNPKAMSANVVLSFQPYNDAAYSYLTEWQAAHPDYKAEELPF
jgi:hypothetical protein